MHKAHPRQAVFPAISFATFLLIVLSQSVYGFSEILRKNEVSIQTDPASSIHIDRGFEPSIKIWEPTILSAAAETDLDPDLIASVIMVESGGQPQVISTSGAVGLMQVMPRDGKASAFQCVNGPCFSNRPSISELMDPDFNIHYGANMLAGLIRKYGSIREGLYAYGPIDVGYSYADLVLAVFNNHQ